MKLPWRESGLPKANVEAIFEISREIAIAKSAAVYPRSANWSIAALTTRLIAFPVVDDREHIECFIGISHNLQLLHRVRRQGDRERSAAFLSMRPAHADRCRNPRDCHPTKRVRLHGCTICSNIARPFSSVWIVRV